MARITQLGCERIDINHAGLCTKALVETVEALSRNPAATGVK
jgi:hypothetical protein